MTGNLTAPAFIPNGSTVPTNGFYLPSANNVAISTNGTGRLFVDSTGRVGLGTASPGGLLELAVAANRNLLFTGVDSDYSRVGGIQGGTNNNRNINITGQNVLLSTGSSGGTTFTERVRIDDVGRVGIGTASPAALLDVEGKTYVEGGYIRFAGDASSPSGTAMWRPAVNVLAFNTTSLERMRLDSSGRLGIGTTAFDAGDILNVASTGDTRIKVSTSSTSAGHNAALRLDATTNGKYTIQVGADTSGGLRVFDNNASAERCRIDSSGRLLVGTSTSSGSATPARLQVKGAAGGTAPFAKVAIISDNNEDAGGIILGSSSTNAVYLQSDPDNLRADSLLGFSVDGTERMRIRNNGSVLIGCTTENARGLTINPQGSGSSPTISFSKNNDGNANACAFLNAGTIIGTISYNTTSTAYNTSSDYRLKENVVLLTGAIDRLQQIPVHRFNFIADPDKTVDGFLAHEAQAIVPECVTGEKDAVDEDGNPVYQGIDQSKLVPLLTAALQEAIAEIASLKDRVAALEA
jgi:hypothetical protein